MINLPVVIFFTLLLGGNWSLVITWQASILICCFKIINNIKCAEYLEKKKYEPILCMQLNNLF